MAVRCGFPCAKPRRCLRQIAGGDLIEVPLSGLDFQVEEIRYESRNYTDPHANSPCDTQASDLGLMPNADKLRFILFQTKHATSRRHIELIGWTSRVWTTPE